MPQQVQLQSFHNKNGHIVEFAGFNLPLWYTGIIPESLAVRNAVGLFDVSHMGRALVTGEESERFLQHVTTNDVSVLADGMGQYSLLCNPEGGIKDDILVLKLQKNRYLIVYNAANRATDFSWFVKNGRELNVGIEDVSNEVALFAVQGPNAIRLMSAVTADSRLVDLQRFRCAWAEVDGCRVLLSRTGYTGEDGFEVFVWNSPIESPGRAKTVWEKLCKMGKPMGLELCGLGARDLLRLEAGLCLYGTDIDETTNPFEARLGFVVKLYKEFIGKNKLQQVKQNGPKKFRVGLVTQGRVIPRHGFSIAIHGDEVGVITSGTLSPIINKGIAMGYADESVAKAGTPADIRIRDRYEPAMIRKTPFYDTLKYGYSRRTLSYSTF